jgi:hypothetical protein
MACKCLQVPAADLGCGLNAIAPLPHDARKGTEGRTARLLRQMGAAQLIANPFQICV